MSSLALPRLIGTLNLRPLVLALALSALSGGSGAQTSEEAARQAAQELKVLVTEGTAVIGDLQPVINSGKVSKSQVAPDVLTQQFKTRYQAATGKPLDTQAKGLVGDTRRTYERAFVEVLTQQQGKLTKGGQDAFVPAYFRALVLREFNKGMRGQLQAYATNREGELINSDSSVKTVMKGSPRAAEVQQWMATGSLDPVVKRSGDAVLGYWPMKLGAACVACHAQNSLHQTEGKFGGALVVEAALR